MAQTSCLEVKRIKERQGGKDNVNKITIIEEQLLELVLILSSGHDHRFIKGSVCSVNGNIDGGYRGYVNKS